MKIFYFVVFTLRITAAFIVPPDILKRLTYRDTAYIIDRILVDPEEDKSTPVEKIKDRSVKNENLKDIPNALNDIVIQDETPKPSNIDIRSFVYLKQKHRTPIINLVHGSPDMLGRTNAEPIANLNKAYLQDFTQKQTQRYIDNFLKGYTYLKPSWLVSDRKSADLSPINSTSDNYLPKLNVQNPARGYQEEEDRDTNMDEKIKFVEFLKPPPLVRCDHKRTKSSDYVRHLQHTTPRNSVGRFDNIIYPLIPSRGHNKAHFSTNHNCVAKETLCSHIYNSHIKDCVRRFLSNSDEPTARFLSKCISNI